MKEPTTKLSNVYKNFCGYVDLIEELLDKKQIIEAYRLYRQLKRYMLSENSAYDMLWLYMTKRYIDKEG